MSAAQPLLIFGEVQPAIRRLSKVLAFTVATGSNSLLCSPHYVTPVCSDSCEPLGTDTFCSCSFCSWCHAIAWLPIQIPGSTSLGGLSFPYHSKMGVSFASTSSIIAVGTCSNLRALRDPRSSARGWSHRTTPFVLVPAAANETAKPAVRAKLPPLVIGNTIGVFVSLLKLNGDTIKTGRVPFCSCPEVGSNDTK